MATKLPNIGIVGLGYWGPNLARNFKSSSDCELKYVCDVDEERLLHIGHLHPDIKMTQDFSVLLDDDEIDAIVIATPVHTHYKMAKKALEAGKHVLVEKPMVSSVKHAEELLGIARDKNLILMVGHTFLHSPAVKTIKEIVDSGEIGDLRYICSRRLNLGLFQKDINVTWDLAPHDISIILFIMGETPSAINCQGNANVTPGVEDVTSMTLTFPSGAFALIQNSWLDPKKVREMTIVGSKKMIVYDDLEPLQKLKIYDQRVDRPPHYDTFAEFHYSYHYGSMYAPHIKQEEPLRVECQHFLECITSGSTPVTDGESGLDVVRLLELSSKSLAKNGAQISVS